MKAEDQTPGGDGLDTDWADSVLSSLGIPRAPNISRPKHLTWEEQWEIQVEADCHTFRTLLEQQANACRESSYARPVLVLLSGLPGTGKSHFAHCLSQQASLIVLNSDRLHKALVAKPVYSGSENTRLFPAFHRLISEYLVEGLPVVFDATNLVEVHRRTTYRIAEDLGVPLVVVRCSAHPAVVHRRLERRAQEQHPDDYSDAGWQVYSRLAFQEEVITVDHMTVDSDARALEAVTHISRLISRSPETTSEDVASKDSADVHQPPHYGIVHDRLSTSAQKLTAIADVASIDESPVGSLSELVDVLELQGVELEISPMFSPEGDPLSLAGCVATELGWQPWPYGALEEATGGRDRVQVLAEAFRLTPNELLRLDRAEKGETYKNNRTVLGRLRLFCRNNGWTSKDRRNNYAQLQHSSKTLRSVNIWYEEPVTGQSKRLIDIYGIGEGYLEAFDHSLNHVDIFRISSIQQVQRTDYSFTVPDSYKASEWLDESELSIHGPLYVKPEPEVSPRPLITEPIQDPDSAVDPVRARWERLGRPARLRPLRSTIGQLKSNMALQPIPPVVRTQNGLLTSTV